MSEEPTKSEEPTGADAGERPLARRALDALVFAPAGFLLTAVEDFPEMAAKGRARMETQLRQAHVLGQFAVAYGRRDLQRRIARLGPRPMPTPEAADPVPPEPAPPSRPVPFQVVPGADALGIPDFDTLSASQVVRRLDGLGSTELQAVYRYELATRGRRTVLHRVQQLLGTEDLPGD